MIRAQRLDAPPGAARGAGAAAWGAWLARGARPDGFATPTPDEWVAILAFAERERVAPLAWRRSGALIRSAAPAEVTTRWRSVAARCDADGRRHVQALREVISALALVDAEPVVLKGPALARRLYGDPGVRPLNDLDLFVAAEARARATAALAAAGWERLEERAPLEEGFRKRVDGRVVFLEIHSSLTDDDLMSHLRLPMPEWEPLDLGDGGPAIRAHSGDLMPAYLAAHLVKHTLAPMLWLLDFSEVWEGLSEAARARATQAARTHRVGRYLDWAARRARRLRAALGGDLDALEALGYGERDRHEVHRLARVAALAATPWDAVRVVGGWAWPPAMRNDPGALLELMAERARKPWQATVAPRVESTTDADRPRAVRVGRESLVEIARAARESAGTLWVRIHGTSMLPAIPRGALVRLSPLPPRALRAGDVVLFQRESGGPVLHRIISVGEGVVRTKGDNCHDADPPSPLDRVLMLAERLSIDGVERPIGPAPRRVLRGLVARLRLLGT